jgi:hypothetical protein
MKALGGLKEKTFAGLVFAVVVGLVAGSLLTQLFGFLPDSVVKEFFTKSVSFGFGFNPDGLVLDLNALKLKLGVTCEFTFLSLVGIAVAAYLFRWYS